MTTNKNLSIMATSATITINAIGLFIVTVSNGKKTWYFTREMAEYHCHINGYVIK